MLTVRTGPNPVQKQNQQKEIPHAKAKNEPQIEQKKLQTRGNPHQQQKRPTPPHEGRMAPIGGMACYHPITGYRTAAGKVTFKQKEGYYDRPVTIACGQCRGCRLERSRQWAVRCMHEAQMNTKGNPPVPCNSFITLTYDDDHLPPDGGLVLEHFQQFVRSFRRAGHKFRYYHCGEYGDLNGRPHYHAILFGIDFPDQVFEETTPHGDKLYSSELLSTYWTKGRSRIGAMTFKSAAYVARYCMKKINGEQAEEHYQKISKTTGEVFQVKPEYQTMSRRPGIGSTWFATYGGDIFPSDECVVNGKVTRPPKFYDSQYELSDPTGHALIKEGRVRAGRKHRSNNSYERLRVRETIQEKRTQQLIRNL